MTPSDWTDATGRLNEIGQLAAGVGHHVINAFSAVVSNAELLRITSESPGRPIDQKALAEAIIRTAVDASGVARRLIDFSRSATATGDGLVDLRQIVESTVSEHRRQGHPGVEWVAELEPVPSIRGNATQLTAMLGHLIRNSLESISKGGGIVALSTSVDDRGWVVIEVRDTGEGMAPKVQERAVEPFFTTKNGHAGVGLSIANGIWRRHRGTLALESQSNDGTRVRLCVEPQRPDSPRHAG